MLADGEDIVDPKGITWRERPLTNENAMLLRHGDTRELLGKVIEVTPVIDGSEISVELTEAGMKLMRDMGELPHSVSVSNRIFSDNQ